MVEEDDSELITALQRRDRGAWSRAVDRHSREVYGFVFHLVRGDRTIAEELNQGTWLQAVDRIDGCAEAKGTFRNWLFGIARKQVAMYYRRHAVLGHRDSLGDSEDPLAEWDRQALLPEDVLELLEQNSAVRAALCLLPEDRRHVMVSKYVEGHSVSTIAAQTGKTVKAVESLLSRAREQLRALLRGYVVTSSGRRDVRGEARND